MGFQFSDRSQELQLRISKFLDDHIYPAEEIYAQQMQEFTEQGDRWQIPQIIEDKKEIAKADDKPVILVCQNGTNSSRMASDLKKQEISVFVLKGGISNWVSEKMPLIN